MSVCGFDQSGSAFRKIQELHKNCGISESGVVSRKCREFSEFSGFEGSDRSCCCVCTGQPAGSWGAFSQSDCYKRDRVVLWKCSDNTPQQKSQEGKYFDYLS